MPRLVFLSASIQAPNSNPDHIELFLSSIFFSSVSLIFLIHLFFFLISFPFILTVHKRVFHFLRAHSLALAVYNSFVEIQYYPYAHTHEHITKEED